MKKLLRIHRGADRRWVGDGFSVRTLFAYPTLGSQVDPFLLLWGEPLDEPLVGHGPFVMNRSEEIQQAILDYQSGGMGHLS